MKTIVFFILLFPSLTFAQNVLFKNVYSTKENISVTLLMNATGCENGIMKQSMPPLSRGTISLGSTNKPGNYLVEFVFPTKRERYNILVLPPSVNIGTLPSIQTIPPADSRYLLFLNKAVEFADNGNYKALLGKVATKFAANHPVDGPLAVVACIAAPVGGPNPVFLFACKSGAQDLAKDLVIIFLESLNEELFAKQKYSKSDFDFFKSNIAVIQYFVNAYTAQTVLDAIATVAPITQTDAGNHLSYGASLTGQVIKKYEFVLKLVK